VLPCGLESARTISEAIRKATVAGGEPSIVIHRFALGVTCVAALSASGLGSVPGASATSTLDALKALLQDPAGSVRAAAREAIEKIRQDQEEDEDDAKPAGGNP
jgi:hypothetical protein